MSLPSRFNICSIIYDEIAETDKTTIPCLVEMIKHGMEKGNNQWLINDDRGDLIGMLRDEKKLFRQADQLILGLVDHEQDITFKDDVLVNILYVTQNFP